MAVDPRVETLLTTIVRAMVAAAPAGWRGATLGGWVTASGMGVGAAYEGAEGAQRGDPEVSDALWDLLDAMGDRPDGIDLELAVEPSGRFAVVAGPRMKTLAGGYLHVLDAGHLPPEPGAGPEETDGAEAGDPAAAVAALRAYLTRRTEILGSAQPPNPAAVPERFEEVERRYGVRLPADLRALYEVSDGHRAGGLLDGHRWLPLAQVIESAQARDRQWPGWERGWNRTVLEAHPAGAVRRMTGNPAWIPFAHDGGGNFLAADMDPAAGGRPGQVIRIGRDHGDRPGYVADSVTTLLRLSVAALEDESYFYDDADYLELDLGLDSAVPARGRITVAAGPAIEGVRPGFQELTVGAGHPLDLTALIAAPALRDLRLRCATADLTPLRELPLESLRLDVETADLSPLRGHPTLRALTLKAARPVDLTPLGTLPHLHGLDLSDAERPAGLEVLAGLKGLRYLSLRRPQWRLLREHPPALAAAHLTGRTPLDDVVQWARTLDGRPAPEEILHHEGELA